MQTHVFAPNSEYGLDIHYIEILPVHKWLLLQLSQSCHSKRFIKHMLGYLTDICCVVSTRSIHVFLHHR